MGFMLFSTLVLIPEFSADAHGLTPQETCGVSSCPAVGFVLLVMIADRRPAYIQDSSQMADRDRMAVPRHRAILLCEPD